ncbi:SACOL1771 family peroxiredoxin [Staphylococcus sp. SQ8-PEA]|uniref:SACOL1771 family peroxiredoxin n=1 Tax=Staphylococcus marylandisciuri TaxID=2981529 RepID=A0ABT2QQ68_9STAP|nr:SACOL1771 family peroxiredoxin [Staphylococcus marylandisciuri]MCU5746121.1 SACOL1771 family peroxiredoxin [Staphylococcus marylandisciuri]
MVSHQFKVSTNWNGGRNQIGTVTGDIIKEEISIPKQLEGMGVGTNPDELLISAASSCYIISLAAVLERTHYRDVNIRLTTIGEAEFKNGKFRMNQIIHYPEITLPPVYQQSIERKLNRLIALADSNCMVSNSLRGNVDIKIIPKLKFDN